MLLRPCWARVNRLLRNPAPRPARRMSVPSFRSSSRRSFSDRPLSFFSLLDQAFPLHVLHLHALLLCALLLHALFSARSFLSRSFSLRSSFFSLLAAFLAASLAAFVYFSVSMSLKRASALARMAKALIACVSACSISVVAGRWVA